MLNLDLTKAEIDIFVEVWYLILFYLFSPWSSRTLARYGQPYPSSFLYWYWYLKYTKYSETEKSKGKNILRRIFHYVGRLAFYNKHCLLWVFFFWYTICFGFTLFLRLKSFQAKKFEINTLYSLSFCVLGLFLLQAKYILTPNNFGIYSKHNLFEAGAERLG